MTTVLSLCLIGIYALILDTLVAEAESYPVQE